MALFFFTQLYGLYQNQSHNSQTAINNSQHDELNSQLIEIKC
jgi:hypothetical protein